MKLFQKLPPLLAFITLLMGILLYALMLFDLPLAYFLLFGAWTALVLAANWSALSRRFKIFLGISLLLSAALAVFTAWFGLAAFFLWYFGFILLTGILFLHGVLRVFRRSLPVSAYVSAYAVFVVGSGGLLLSGLTAPRAEPLPSQPVPLNEELAYLYQTDQSDRLSGVWVFAPERDSVRLARVKQLYATGQITAPRDQYHAAAIFQHGQCAEEYRLAYELAQAAWNAGISEAEFWAKASYDRWQMSLGKPQKYGTQLIPFLILRPCEPPK